MKWILLTAGVAVITAAFFQLRSQREDLTPDQLAAKTLAIRSMAAAPGIAGPPEYLVTEREHEGRTYHVRFEATYDLEGGKQEKRLVVCTVDLDRQSATYSAVVLREPKPPAPPAPQTEAQRDHEAYLRALKEPPPAQTTCRAIRSTLGNKAIGQLTYNEMQALQSCQNLGY